MLRTTHRRRCGLLLLVLGLIGLGLEHPAPAQVPPATKPTPRPSLSREQEKQVEKWQESIAGLMSQGQFTEALGPAREVRALCERVLGVDHWRSADARRAIADLDLIARLPEQGRKAILSGEDLNDRL